MLINGIVAMDKNKGIGINNQLPWKLKEDLQRFQKFTTGKGNNAIIMGKNTWNSIKTLKNRDHLILSSSMNLEYINKENIIKSFINIDSLLKFTEEKKYDELWVIGGSQIYKQFLELNLINNFYVTMIDDEYTCDTYLSSFPDNYFIFQTNLLKEKNSLGKNTHMIVFKKIEKNMKVIYNDTLWNVENIHYDDYPNCYFTIKNTEGREIQTINSKLKIYKS